VVLGLEGDASAAIERVIDVVQRADDRDFDTAITGEWTADRDVDAILDEDLRKGELYSACRRRC
jgi:hypothetical protein